MRIQAEKIKLRHALPRLLREMPRLMGGALASGRTNGGSVGDAKRFVPNLETEGSDTRENL